MRYSILLIFLISCSTDYTPKPRAYFKLDFPEKEYVKFENRSYLFKYPTYSKIEIDKKSKFINLNFETYSGKLHTTYFKLDDDLSSHIEQSRSLAFKHNIQADAISEQVYIDEKNKIFVEPFLPNHKIGIIHLASGIKVNDKDMRNEKNLEIELNTLDNNKISKSLRFKTN